MALSSKMGPPPPTPPRSLHFTQVYSAAIFVSVLWLLEPWLILLAGTLLSIFCIRDCFMIDWLHYFVLTLFAFFKKVCKVTCDCEIAIAKRCAVISFHFLSERLFCNVKFQSKCSFICSLHLNSLNSWPNSRCYKWNIQKSEKIEKMGALPPVYRDLSRKFVRSVRV
jgi:hypothetical protein